MTNQEIDLKLLEQDIPALIQKYQYKIAFIVNRFVERGYFRRHAQQDMIQSVNEQLLRRAAKIQVQYKPPTTISTYLGSIIRNICIDVYRKAYKIKNVSLDAMPSLWNQAESTLTGDGQMIIKDEINRVGLLLQAYKRHQFKLVVLLKLICRIPLLEDDITNWLVDCSEFYLILLMQTFGGSYQHLTDKKVIENITYYANQIENKKLSPDNTRKWIGKRMIELIEQLNKGGTTSYDKETLKILLTYYFRREEGF